MSKEFYASEDIEAQQNSTDSIGDDVRHQVSKILHSDDGNYIYLGDNKFKKDELMAAFGGTLTMGWSLPPVHKFANPSPLGLSAFAVATFIASMINARAQGVSNDRVNLGIAMFYGGFIQFIAGMWEMSIENTFGALALSSYGGYWMSSAAIHIPFFHIQDSYTSEKEFRDAMGIFYIAWFLFTCMLVLCTLKSTVAFSLLLILVALRLLLLAIASFSDKNSVEVAAGVVGVIISILALYNAYAGVANPQNSYYTVKPIPMPIWNNKRK
ncbi:hypothetical protein DAMA08_043570 [Martiniozyma asiatica (nom. inval.)]|nr:hypothetical protein DAMA08_043570 [Martiniozyma asiatica]